METRRGRCLGTEYIHTLKYYPKGVPPQTAIHQNGHFPHCTLISQNSSTPLNSHPSSHPTCTLCLPSTRPLEDSFLGNTNPHLSGTSTTYTHLCTCTYMSSQPCRVLGGGTNGQDESYVILIPMPIPNPGCDSDWKEGGAFF